MPFIITQKCDLSTILVDPAQVTMYCKHKYKGFIGISPWIIAHMILQKLIICFTLSNTLGVKFTSQQNKILQMDFGMLKCMRHTLQIIAQ